MIAKRRMGKFNGGPERIGGGRESAKQARERMSENEAPKFFADETLSYSKFENSRNPNGLPGEQPKGETTPDQRWDVDGRTMYGDHVCSSSGNPEHVRDAIRLKLERAAKPIVLEVEVVTVDLRFAEGGAPDLRELRNSLRRDTPRTLSGRSLKAVLVRTEIGAVTLFSNLDSFPESPLP